MLTFLGAATTTLLAFACGADRTGGLNRPDKEGKLGARLNSGQKRYSTKGRRVVNKKERLGLRNRGWVEKGRRVVDTGGAFLFSIRERELSTKGSRF